MFRERLQAEFTARKSTNARYSLRAFAAFAGVDHSTLSKILSGDRKATSTQLRAIGRKLGMSNEEIAIHLAAEHVPDAAVRRREAMLTHWTAEALAIVSENLHWRMFRLSRTPAFRRDCRWIARELGASVDEVNVALTRLLRLELMDGQWLGCAMVSTESAFRKLALDRVRKKAAEDRVEIGRVERKK